MIQENSTTTAALGETLSLVHSIKNTGARGIQVYCSITVTGQDLDQFAIKVKASDDDTAQTLFNAAADFTSPTGDLIGTSGDLTALAVGTGWFKMNVDGYQTIEVWAASGNVAGSGIVVRSSMSTQV